jgi:hypothetical protein
MGGPIPPPNSRLWPFPINLAAAAPGMSMVRKWLLAKNEEIWPMIQFAKSVEYCYQFTLKILN